MVLEDAQNPQFMLYILFYSHTRPVLLEEIHIGYSW